MKTNQLNTKKIKYIFEFSASSFVVSCSVFYLYMLRVYECVFCSVACFACLSVHAYDSKSIAGVPVVPTAGLWSRIQGRPQREIMLFIGKPKGRSRMISNRPRPQFNFANACSSTDGHGHISGKWSKMTRAWDRICHARPRPRPKAQCQRPKICYPLPRHINHVLCACFVLHTNSLWNIIMSPYHAHARPCQHIQPLLPGIVHTFAALYHHHPPRCKHYLGSKKVILGEICFLFCWLLFLHVWREVYVEIRVLRVLLMVCRLRIFGFVRVWIFLVLIGFGFSSIFFSFLFCRWREIEPKSSSRRAKTLRPHYLHHALTGPHTQPTTHTTPLHPTTLHSHLFVCRPHPCTS